MPILPDGRVACGQCHLRDSSIGTVNSSCFVGSNSLFAITVDLPGDPRLGLSRGLGGLGEGRLKEKLTKGAVGAVVSFPTAAVPLRTISVLYLLKPILCVPGDPGHMLG